MGDARVVIAGGCWGRGGVGDASVLAIIEEGLGLGDARVIVIAR